VFKPAVQPNILVGSGGRAKETLTVHVLSCLSVST
jgi:hypothetical protein